MQDTKIVALSGGQRARLAMLIQRLKNPNFYLLDELTNHLDIEGQEALEEELCTHGAAALLVSHDRSFVRNVGNRFWQVIGQQIKEVDDPEAFFESELAADNLDHSAAKRSSDDRPTAAISAITPRKRRQNGS